MFPFNVSFEVKETGIEGTWLAFEEAFSNDETYTVKRISETIFRIERRDEMVLETPLECSYITTEGFTAEFLGKLSNKADNGVIIKNELKPKEAVGIWIQRIIKKNHYPTNEELLKEYKDKYVRETVEGVELVLSYNLVDDKNYQETDYNEDYS